MKFLSKLFLLLMVPMLSFGQIAPFPVDMYEASIVRLEKLPEWHALNREQQEEFAERSHRVDSIFSNAITECGHKFVNVNDRYKCLAKPAQEREEEIIKMQMEVRSLARANFQSY